MSAGRKSHRGRPEPLREAARVQRAAARQGFDWPAGHAGVWRKLVEEIAELRSARGGRRRAEEFGDLLFMMVNLSRHLGVDARAALAAATRKFRRRYGYILRHAASLPPLGHRRRLARMETLWQEAKRREKR